MTINNECKMKQIWFNFTYMTLFYKANIKDLMNGIIFKFSVLNLFESGPCYISQAGCKTSILPLQPPWSWNCKQVSPGLNINLNLREWFLSFKIGTEMARTVCLHVQDHPKIKLDNFRMDRVGDYEVPPLSEEF